MLNFDLPEVFFTLMDVLIWKVYRFARAGNLEPYQPPSLSERRFNLSVGGASRKLLLNVASGLLGIYGPNESRDWNTFRHLYSEDHHHTR